MLLRLNKTCSLTHIFTVQVCKRYNQHLTLMFRQASQLSLGCIFLWCLGDALIHSLTTRSLLKIPGSYLGRLSKCSFTHSQTPLLHSILHVVMYPIILSPEVLHSLVKSGETFTTSDRRTKKIQEHCYKCTL